MADGDDADSLHVCRAVRVGVPPRDALLCRQVFVPQDNRLFERSGGGVVRGLSVVVVEHHRARRLLRVPIWAGPQDQLHSRTEDPCLPVDPSYIWLASALREDGLALTLTDRPQRRCRDAIRAALAIDSDSGVVVAQSIQKVCASRATYRWSAGRFVRASP